MSNKVKGTALSGAQLVKTTGVEKLKAKLHPPSLYKVLLMNDDYTPMGFVIEVLEQFFGMNPERAMQTMLQVHHHGKAVCGIFSYDIAQTKITQVNHFSQEHEHPLLCLMEDNGC